MLGLTLLGVQVGPAWERWRHRLEYLDSILAAALVVAVVLYLVRRARNRRGTGIAPGLMLLRETLVRET